MQLMKRLLVVVGAVAVLGSAVLFAQTVSESSTQMTLAVSPAFLNRLQYLLTQQARVVKAEALATACHAKRSTFADVVISDPLTSARVAAVMMVGGTNLIGTVVGNANTDKIDSSATDAAILAQTATFWSALSKCDTGS
jgi:hypothetical protein